MTPGVAVYTIAGGSLVAARDDRTKSFVYLGVSAVLFVLISLIPGGLRKSSRR